MALESGKLAELVVRLRVVPVLGPAQRRVMAEMAVMEHLTAGLVVVVLEALLLPETMEPVATLVQVALL